MVRLSIAPSTRSLAAACVVFLLAAIAAATMIRHGQEHNRQQERARVFSLAEDRADSLQRNIERALSVDYALAAFVRQGKGKLSDFEAVGRELLPFYPGVASVSLAPGGVIQKVVPIAGNKMAIGQDLLANPETKREASLAKESGKLVLAGPFQLVQGDVAVVGRLPLYLPERNGERRFWGFINAVVRLRDAIETAGLPQLAERGIDYKLWRIHPDTGKVQIIAASSANELIDPVEHRLELPQGVWTLSAAPGKGWGDLLEYGLVVALGLLFCLLLAYVAKLLVEAKAHERGLEALVAQRTGELQAREEELKRAQAVAHVGNWVFDFGSNELRGSAEVLRIFGRDEGEAFDLRIFRELVHADDRPSVDGAWNSAQKGNDPYDIEYRIVVGGEVRWVHSSAELTRAQDGTLLRALGTVQDITERKRREEELQHFRAAMDASADAIYLVDRQSMRFVDVNEVACRMLGRTHPEVLALGPDGVLGVTRDQLERTYDSIIAGGPGTEPVELLRQREDGRQVWVELRRRAERIGGGWMIVTSVRDITERKRTEQALRESAEKLRLFADSVPAMTASFDAELRLLFVNKRYADYFGYVAADIIGKHLRELVGERVYAEIEGYFARALQGQQVSYERVRRPENGEPRYLEVKLVPHVGEQGELLGCFAVTLDITDHRLVEDRITRVAHHDSLTGLPNRLLFNDRLSQAISLAKRDSRQFALLYLDLDRFKPVNDGLGHAVGDELLQAVAERIRRSVRESDTVARVGGDEFTVILPDIAGRGEAEIVAKKIVAALAANFRLGGETHSVDIGASIGIALYPRDARDADALVKAADAAMYRAKQLGNSFLFYAA